MTSMELDEVDADIEMVLRHLDDTGGRKTRIEALLTTALLVRTCSIYEKEIRRVVISRTHGSEDADLEQFVEGVLRRRRYLKLSDLRGEILDKFGKKYVEEFNKRVKGTVYETSYYNITSNRDHGAHGNITSTTVDELKKWHPKARHVLAAFSDVLCRPRDGP